MGDLLNANEVMALLPLPRVSTAPPFTVAPTVSPITSSPTLSPLAATQQPVNVNVVVSRDETTGEQRPMYYQYQYPVGVPQLPGVPGVPGVVAQYPGLATDSSIKIGSISSSYAQGNTTVGDGTVGGFGGLVGGSTYDPLATPTPVPTASPSTFPPDDMLPMLAIDPPLKVDDGPGWGTLAVIACVLVLLGIAAYFAYRAFFRSPGSNSANNGNNGNNGKNSKTPPAKNTTRGGNQGRRANNANFGNDYQMDSNGADTFDNDFR